MSPHPPNIARRRSSSHHPNSQTETLRFPDLSQHDTALIDDMGNEGISRGPSPKPLPNGLPVGLHSSERWPPRRSKSGWRANWMSGTGKTRQKSLSEAIRTVRGRKASVSENAHEIAESLKAPVSFKLLILCSIWYSASILTNTSSKAILTALNKPVTLTLVQFLLVSFWCVFLSWLAKHNATVRENVPVLKNGIRRPSREIFMATLPLTGFMIGGHILNSDAMARIPVSLVHTIKGLSPLMTVFAYRVFYDIRYSMPTYLSLIPLTVGVVMACAAEFRGNVVGLAYAFGSAILFVTQNIVSKRIFNEAAIADADGTIPLNKRKPDKLNLLCYSSAMSLALTLPIWLWSEGLTMAADFFKDSSIELSGRPGALDHGRLALEFVFNGTFHFGQSLVAFVLLGLVSPVTYSVASLIKRVAVIVFAILWVGKPMTSLQGVGIGLTFLGLYLYDRTHDSARADRRAKEMAEGRQALLPLTTGEGKRSDGPVNIAASPMTVQDLPEPYTGVGGYVNGHSTINGPTKPTPNGNVMANGAQGGGYGLPPGTKAEETWKKGDAVGQNVPVLK